MRTLACLLALWIPTALAQPADPVSQARADVDTLASAAYAGRGYAPHAYAARSRHLPTHLSGRENARGGAARAEAYIERRLREVGIEPAFEDGFRQPFTFEKDLITGTPLLDADGIPLTLGDDFLPYGSSASGAGQNLDVVDVGHGFVLPRLGIDAYEGLDVRGKAVVISQAIPDSLYQTEGVLPAFLTDAYRMDVAGKRGAAALLFLKDAPLFGHTAFDAPLPVFDMRREAWPGASRVTLQVEAAQNAPVLAANIVGQVRGTTQPDSVLLVTAHFDGLGSLGPDHYFPGANDNASGVAMLLALAESVQREPLRYTVVFAALGGEESGLKGARYLASFTPFPTERVRFLLNFDMVASAEDGLLVFGGRDQPAEYALLERLSAEQSDGPLAARANRANSDHWAFTERGVPGFYLLTKDGTQPYHSLRDRPETLEWDDFARALRLADAFLREL